MPDDQLTAQDVLAIPEIQALTQGGDTFSHWHSEDRVPTQSFLHGLQTVANRRVYTANVILTGSEDFSAVDTSSNNVTVTLPRAVNGLEVEILKLSPAYVIIITPQVTDSIMGGSTSATVSVGGAALRFKAFDRDWRLI